MQILNGKLEKEVLDTIGVDQIGIFKIYRDFKVSMNRFESNFVMEDPFERLLSEKIWVGFLYFDTTKTINRIVNNENS